MKNNQLINIAEILRNKPKGTVLYSPMVGKTNFSYLSDNEDSVEAIWTENKFVEYSFDKYGRYTAGGEMVLFPSNAMRDWGKFAWKKGDVLANNEGTCECVFEGWYNDDYTQFKAKHWLNSRNENNIKYLSENQPLTSLFMKEDEESGEYFLNTIEERLGGKLNMETLEVELIKPKWTPKPFDKVLVKDNNDNHWKCDIFSHKDSNNWYVCVDDDYKQCIPYNEETAKLIGTTDNWED